MSWRLKIWAAVVASLCSWKPLHSEPLTAASELNEEAIESDMLFLLVDKSKLRADLKTWPSELGESETLVSFRIAIGKEKGDKQVEGDNRTPEGIYFAQKHIDGKQLPARYGPYAVPIDFPNPVDKKEGKTGYGIWLHGVEKDARVEESNVTEGCVAFYNSDIEALINWVKPFQSVVLIAENADLVNQEKDILQVQQLTQSWYESWAQKKLDNYIAFYHEKFRYRAMGKPAFADYKRRVFESYERMQVELTDIRVFTHEDYAIAVFNQDFNGDDRYVSEGRKILYWQKDIEGQWKIAHEVFENRRFEFPKYSRALLARLSRESPSAKQFESSSSL